MHDPEVWGSSHSLEQSLINQGEKPMGKCFFHSSLSRQFGDAFHKTFVKVLPDRAMQSVFSLRLCFPVLIPYSCFMGSIFQSKPPMMSLCFSLFFKGVKVKILDMKQSYKQA